MKKSASERFNAPTKVIQSPSQIMANFIHHFSRLEKSSRFDPHRYSFLYHFFSYRDFAFWVTRRHNGNYDLRGYYPIGFNVSKYSQNTCFHEVHSEYTCLFCHNDLRVVSREFSLVVSECLRFVSLHSSYKSFTEV